MERTKLVRLFSLVLALVMVCTVFLFGCKGDEVKTTQGQQNKTEQNQTLTQEEGNKDAVYEAEVKDLQGHEFVFYVKHSTSQHLNLVEVYAEGPNGDKVNDAVFKRNSQLQSTYNCKISEVRESGIQAVLREPLITGEYVCDFIFATAKDARTFAKSSLLADMTQLENINLEKAWIDQDAVEGLNMAGKVFFITGDACTIDDRRMEGMYFNTEIIEAMEGNINLYQEVRDGKWTIARMLELVNATAADFDGDGQVTFESKADRYGYMAGAYCDHSFVTGCNVTLSEFDASGTLEVPLQPKRELLDVWGELRGLLTSPYRQVSASGSLFRSGRATFYCCNIGSILNWSDSQYDLGILPYPKRNEAQEHYYLTGLFSLGGYSIPNTVDNDPNRDFEKAGFASGKEMCAYFLEAFSYYSMDTLTPAFFDQVLGKQLVTDTESIEMLEIALAHRIYDPVVGYNFGSMQTGLFNACGSAGTGLGTDVNYDNFTSTYMANVNKAREAVQDYLTFIQEGATA